MKKVIRFSKYIIPAVVVSSVLILSGLFPILTKGINFGIDFKPGLVSEVRIVPAAMELSYNGAAAVSVEVNSADVSLVISGVGAENETRVYPFAQYKTVGELAAAMSEVAGLTAVAVAPQALTTGLFVNSASSPVLSNTVYRLFSGEKGQLADVEAVRDALSSLEDVSVKIAGEGASEVFQIRIGAAYNVNIAQGSAGMQENLNFALSQAFGEENIAIIKTDFIGAQYSQSLIMQSVILVVAALFLIWIYATIRFKWDFALASVIAIIHDALIIIVFIAWTQMEFSTTTLAAILTILGYGINDTVVVLDRVRENVKKINTKKFMDIIDISQTECFGRTMITTVTTMLAVAALVIFTSGSIHDFAIALMIGMVSSAYSTIMITSAFLSITRKNWKPSDEVKSIAAEGAIVDFPGK